MTVEDKQLEKIPEYEFIPNSVNKLSTDEVTGRVLETLTALAYKIDKNKVIQAEWRFSPEYIRTASGWGNLYALEFNIKMLFDSSISTITEEKK